MNRYVASAFRFIVTNFCHKNLNLTITYLNVLNCALCLYCLHLYNMLAYINRKRERKWGRGRKRGEGGTERQKL